MPQTSPELEDIIMNRKIRAYYDNGWHGVTIQWKSPKMDQDRVFFFDGTEDYIKSISTDVDEIIPED